MNNIKEKIGQRVEGIMDIKKKELSSDLEVLKRFDVEEILGGINDYFFNGKGEISTIIPEFKNDKELYNYDLRKNPPKIQLSVDFACLKKELDKANLKISVETAQDERLKKRKSKLLLSYDDSDYNHLSEDIKTNSIYTVRANYNGGTTADSIKEGTKNCLIELLCKFVLNDTNYPFTELNKGVAKFLDAMDFLGERDINIARLSERCDLSKLSNGDKLKTSK